MHTAAGRLRRSDCFARSGAASHALNERMLLRTGCSLLQLIRPAQTRNGAHRLCKGVGREVFHQTGLVGSGLLSGNAAMTEFDVCPVTILHHQQMHLFELDGVRYTGKGLVGLKLLFKVFNR